MRTFRWMIGFAVLSCWLMVVTACSPPSSQSRTIRLVEVTHSMFYAPQYVAIRKGFFKELGLTVELTNGFGGDKTMTALLSGDADIVLVGAEAAVYVTARGASRPVVGIAQLTQTDGSFLVARNQTGPFRWSDLRGKSLLGQRKGGMPQMVSEYVQRLHGLKPHKDVKIIQNVDYKNLGNAFAAGTGDYVQLFEPVASKLEQEGKGKVVASFGKDSGRLPYTIYITSQSNLEQDPDTLLRFIRAVYQGQKWVQSHSVQEIAEVIAPEFPDTNRAVLEKVLQRYKEQQAWATDPIIDRQEYGHMIDIMRQAGELPGNVPYDTIVKMELAKKAMR